MNKEAPAMKKVRELNEAIKPGRKLPSPPPLGEGLSEFLDIYCCGSVPKVISADGLKKGYCLVQCKKCATAYYVKEKDLVEGCK